MSPLEIIGLAAAAILVVAATLVTGLALDIALKARGDGTNERLLAITVLVMAAGGFLTFAALICREVF